MAKLIGVLVTYERPEEVEETLGALDSQTRRLDGLLVVDNSTSEETQRVLDSVQLGLNLTSVRSPENLGFAGGVRLGMERLLEELSDDDWIVVLDDDDPPASRAAFERLEAFAHERLASDPHTAVVGIHGGRFDLSKGRIGRVQDDELVDVVELDYIGGNGLPCYLVRALREVGLFSEDIFFGLSEVEHGVRLRAAGRSIYADGRMWREARVQAGRLGVAGKPSIGLGDAGWRRYYTLRNLLYILRRAGRWRTAVKVTAVVLIGKPLLNIFVSPRAGWQHLTIGLAAARDGWMGRWGRTREPHPWGHRPTKATRSPVEDQ